MRPVVGFIALQGHPAARRLWPAARVGLADRGSRTIPGALGAALLLGTSAMILGLVILLALGVQFTLLTALLLAIVLAALGFWRGRRSAQPSQSRAPPSVLAAIAAAAAAAYALYGAHAFDRLATVQDDARIWSLKGVALLVLLARSDDRRQRRSQPAARVGRRLRHLGDPRGTVAGMDRGPQSHRSGATTTAPRAQPGLHHRSRSHLQSAATAIADQVVTTWSWQVSIFLAVCALALVSGTAARLAGFYLLSVGLLIASLLWLYATTSTSLAFLIPTSVYRTIDVFTVLTLFASARILTRLLGTWDLALFRSPRRATPG
jgi:hypothetical protein